MRNTRIDRQIIKMGKDLVVTIQNENGHIGSVVTAYPYEKQGEIKVSLNVINTLGHKDDTVAIKYAKALAVRYNCVVTCICGIHIDDILQEEIVEILKFVDNDIRSLACTF